MELTLPTREQMQDAMGKPLTQGLFLEINYGEAAVYTLKEQDHELNGKQYPSLKRLYLECADPTEYEFATKHLLGWKHWLRLCENKALRTHIDEWRDELEIKLRSKAIAAIISQSGLGPLSSVQASKWVADRGWAVRGAGRPSKADVEREKKIQAGIGDEYSADLLRLVPKG
jgi:hypothetical protein